MKPFLLLDPDTGKIEEFNKGDIIIQVGGMHRYKVTGTWDLGIWARKVGSKERSDKLIHADRLSRENWITIERAKKK